MSKAHVHPLLAPAKPRVWPLVVAELVALVLLVWIIAGGAAGAQTQAVQTQPSLAYSGDASGTIAVTNTFQTIWSAVKPTAANPRRGCLIVNTSADEQWVFFGADTDTPTKAKSVPLNPATGVGLLGGWVSCATGSGSALQDHVWITGTATDAFVAKLQ